MNAVWTRRAGVSVLAALAALPIGCGGDVGSGADSLQQTDGGISGGNTGAGGRRGSGGASASGGTASAGGASSSGGSASSGGTSPSGGTTSSGGATSDGGAPGSGGTTSDGGTPGSGGASSSGGSASSGGASPSGGATSTGGTTADGGTPGSGGTTSDAGTPDSGGAPNPTDGGTSADADLPESGGSGDAGPDSCTETTVTLSYTPVANEYLYVDTTGTVAQTFTTVGRMDVESVSLPLWTCKGNGIVDARLTIAEVRTDGAPDWTKPLGSDTVLAADVRGSCVAGDVFETETFRFSGISLRAGTQYALVLEAIGTSAGGQGGIYWRRSSTPTDPSDPYSGGISFGSQFGSQPNPQLDLDFLVTGTDPTSCP